MSNAQAMFLKTAAAIGADLPRWRRTLHKLTITEISGVDRPCQEGARVAILKRAQTTQETEMEPFDKRVSDILAGSNGMTRSAAMSKAAREYPAEFEAYQNRGAEIAKAAAAPRAPDVHKCEQEFNDLVRDYMKRYGISKCAAMSRVATERPAAVLALNLV